MPSVSARRPTHRPAAQQVHVNVEDTLACPLPAVEDEAVTVEAALRDYGAGCSEEAGNVRIVLGADVVSGGDMFFRNDQHVMRG